MSSFLWVLYILHIVRSVIQGMGNTVIPLVSGIFEFIMRTGATLILPVLLEKMEFYSQRYWHGWAPIWC